MNKKLIALAITLVFLIVGFSGCTNEDTNFIESNNIKLIGYEVVSYKLADSPIQPKIILGEGFNYKEDMMGFMVSGEIKNNFGEPLKKIKVIGNFYDGSKLLGNSDTIIKNVPDGETRDFVVFFHKRDFSVDYLLVVDSVSFDFQIERVEI